MSVCICSCVAEEGIKGFLAVYCPVDDLSSIALDEELGVLVEDRARWHAAPGTTRHLDLLTELEIHLGAVHTEGYLREDSNVEVKVSLAFVLI